MCELSRLGQRRKHLSRVIGRDDTLELRNLVTGHIDFRHRAIAPSRTSPKFACGSAREAEQFLDLGQREAYGKNLSTKG